MMAGGDRRDATTWVVLELTRTGEIKAEEGVLAELVRKECVRIDNYPIFVPAVTYNANGHRVTVHLMQGYAFIASGLPEPVYLTMEGTQYIRKVLTKRTPSGMRVLSVVSDAEIEDMRRKLAVQVSSDIAEGMRVKVTDGTYGRLDGTVIEVEDTAAHVRFTLRSIDLIARIPRVFLAPADEDEGDEP